MKMYTSGQRGFSWNKQGRRAVLAAIGSLGVAASFAHAQTASTLYFDNNGTSATFGAGTGTWNSTNVNWATTTAGTTDVSWVPGDIAAFQATITTVVSGVQSVSGLVFNGGGNSGTTPNLIAANSSAALDFGSNNFTLTNATNTKQIIAVPIRGSGTMTIIGNAGATTGTAPVDLAGDLSQFTGNIIVNNGTTTLTNGNGNVLQMDVAPGNPNAIISLDQGVGLEDNNPIGIPGGTVTFTGGTAVGTSPGSTGDPLSGLSAATPMITTLANPIVLNYKGTTNGSTNVIGAANGANIIENNGGNITTVSYQKVLIYSGVISSPSTVTTNLLISGSRGTTVMAGANTYNGNTTVGVANTNGMLVLGADNTLPSTTNVIIGTSATNAIGPIDLDGHNQTFSSLNSANTSVTAANGTGNIYNLSFSGMPSSYAPYSNPSGNAASITLTPAVGSNTKYIGDIGDTSTSIPPLNGVVGSGNVPYTTAGQNALTNISLTLNGPTGGVGTNSLTLAPITNLPSGNEYSGTTTVNNGAVLVLGRVTSSGFGTGYTVTGNGNVTINSGAQLASVATGTSSYAGGFGGNLELKGGSTLNVGGTAAVGSLSTSSMTIDAGANLNFDFGNSATNFDQLYLNGGLTLDTSGNSTLNLGLASGVTGVTPGTYTLIDANGGLTSDGVHGLTLGTQPSGTQDKFTLATNGNLVQVVVAGPVLRWDPTGTGAANSGSVTEGAGSWTTGVTPFLNLFNNTETTWSNSTTNDVLIGNDVTQVGGIISLGSNINVNGKLTFGPIYPGNGYNITDNGTGSILTLGGGLSVNNSAAVYNTDGSIQSPSAEIDAPITLALDQSWNVDSGQFLDVKGVLTGNATTLTKVGSGTVFFEHSGGSLGTLNANSGVVQLGAADALGNAVFNINGGGVVFAVNGTPTNTVNFGASGGSLGATAGFNVVLPANITSTNPVAVIGGGTTNLSGNLSLATFTSALTGSGVGILSGTDNIGTFLQTSGVGALTGTGSIGVLTTTGGQAVVGGTVSVNTINQNAGSTAIAGTNSIGTLNQNAAMTYVVGTANIGSVLMSGGTLQIGAGTTSGALNAGTILNLSTGTSTGTIAFNRSDTYTFTSTLGGSSISIQQSGTGTTIMANVNASAGGTAGTGINSGTIALGANNPLGLSTLTINGPGSGVAALNLSGFNQTVQGLRSGGTVGNALITNDQATFGTLTTANTGAAEYDGLITGNVNVVHTGSASATFGGAINVAGSIVNTAGDQLALTSTVIANLVNSGSGTLLATGTVTGASTVTSTGSGTINLTGTNDFTGSITVSNGTLTAASINPVGTTGPLGNPSAGNTAITLGGNGTTGILDYEGSQSFTLGRPLTMAAGGIGALRLGNGTATATIPSGDISGSGGYEKIGVGTTIIVGTETFSGPLEMIRGNLNIDTVADIGQPSGIGTGATNPNIIIGDGSGNSSTISFNNTTPEETNRPFVQNQVGGALTIMAGDLSAPGAVATSNLALSGGINLQFVTSVSTTGGTVVFGGAGTITVQTNGITGANGHVDVGVGGATEPTTNGTGTLILNVSNSYGGGTYIRNGVVVVSSDSNLGAAGGSVNFTGVGTDTATLLLTGAVSGTRPLNFVNASNATNAIDVGAFNGTFGAAAGTASLSKYGIGNLGVTAVNLTAPLNINAGTFSIVGPRGTSASAVTALNIAGTMGSWSATADLGANDMVVDYTGSSPLATVLDQLHSGANGGLWNGMGITSSAAAAARSSGHSTGLGALEASTLLGASGGTFDGLTVDSTAVLLRYAYSGDANLNGSVDSSDFAILAANYGKTGSTLGWTAGDFNYDGTVNALDFNALASNYGLTLPASGAVAGSVAAAAAMPSAQSLGSMVPEPGSIGLFGLLGLGLARRRRNSR